MLGAGLELQSIGAARIDGDHQTMPFPPSGAAYNFTETKNCFYYFDCFLSFYFVQFHKHLQYFQLKA